VYIILYYIILCTLYYIILYCVHYIILYYIVYIILYYIILYKEPHINAVSVFCMSQENLVFNAMPFPRVL